MKTFCLSIAAAAALAVSAGSAAAQSPGCATCCDGHAGCISGLGGHGHAYGWHPFFSKIGGGGHGLFGYGMFGGKSLFCNHGHLFGEGGGAFGGGQIDVVDPRSGNAGQLVFPQNPFVRGPRDYFMWDER
jgi:hypothetical protein